MHPVRPEAGDVALGRPVLADHPGQVVVAVDQRHPIEEVAGALQER